VTLSFGGSGGIITPIFFVGSIAGNLLGHLPGFDLSVFSAIGMVSLLAGAQYPISASITAVELFGPQVALTLRIMRNQFSDDRPQECLSQPDSLHI
jgi:H+/Cl- antiporter ClcA